MSKQKTFLIRLTPRKFTDRVTGREVSCEILEVCLSKEVGWIPVAFPERYAYAKRVMKAMINADYADHDEPIEAACK